MTGYTTIDDVLDVMQESGFSGHLAADSNDAVVRTIEGVSGHVEKVTKRHWYVSGGLSGDDEGVVDSGPLTRDDEHDLPTHGAFVDGASSDGHYHRGRNTDSLLETGPTRRRFHRQFTRRKKAEIRIATGDVFAFEAPLSTDVPAYTRITFDRKDVEAVNELSVIDADGGYDDWVADSSFSGGVGNSFRGDDYWVRINNDGVSELYLDVHSLDDDFASFSNAVYVDLDYGHDGLDDEIRTGVAQLVAAELVVDDEFRASIPDDGQLVNVETKAERWERLGWAKLRPHVEDESALPDGGE